MRVAVLSVGHQPHSDQRFNGGSGPVRWSTFKRAYSSSAVHLPTFGGQVRHPGHGWRGAIGRRGGGVNELGTAIDIKAGSNDSKRPHWDYFLGRVPGMGGKVECGGPTGLTPA